MEYNKNPISLREGKVFIVGQKYGESGQVPPGLVAQSGQVYFLFLETVAGLVRFVHIGMDIGQGVIDFEAVDIVLAR